MSCKNKYFISILILMFCIFIFGCNNNLIETKEINTTQEIKEETKIETKISYDTIKYNVKFIAQEGGYISGIEEQNVEIGCSIKSVKAIPYSGYHFLYWSDGVKDQIRNIEYVYSDIVLYAIFKENVYEYPDFYINTAGGRSIKSKEEYVNCVASVVDKNYPDNNFNNLDALIRLRGNSTSSKPKKPYRIKFDKKIDLFGNGEAKDWTLIANYVDPSLIRNYLAYNIAKNFDHIQFTTSTQFVNLYLNGEYQGLYLVCEQVEVGKNRINIDESIDDDSLNFVVELDNRVYEENRIEGLEYVKVGSNPFAIKFPDPDDDVTTRAYVSRIKEHLEKQYDLIKNGSWNDICEAIDVNTFVDGYIIHEIFSCVDVGYASWYMYKDKDGKLCNGPIWDFDISAGNCDYNDRCKSNRLIYANANTWYKYLILHKEFKELIKTKLNRYYDQILLDIDLLITDVLKYRSEFENNFVKWKTLGSYVWPNPKELVNIDNWAGHVSYVREWLIKKINYVKEFYSGE